MPSDRTLDSIRLVGLREQAVITRGVEFYDCGCDRFLADDGRDERWYLCQYHEGYDDASEETDRLRRGIADIAWNLESVRTGIGAPLRFIDMLVKDLRSLLP